MTVLVFPPRKRPYLFDLDDSLKAKQSIVGGPIDVFDPWGDSPVIVLNDEGKNSKLPITCSVRGVSIAGTFFICERERDGSLSSINPKKVCEYLKMIEEG